MITAYSLSRPQDVVGVFDGYSQVFALARPMQAGVKEEAKLMEHPLESGATVTDHMVVQPVSLELGFTLNDADYRATYNEIRSLFLAGTILTVQTKTGIYRNMLIAAMPHEEAAERFDAVTLTLTLKEITLITPEYTMAYRPQNPAQADTAERGEVQGQEADAGTGSFLARVFS
jgi:hypothetical protein